GLSGDDTHDVRRALPGDLGRALQAGGDGPRLHPHPGPRALAYVQPLPRGGQRAPRPRRVDGGDQRPPRSPSGDRGPRFDVDVPLDGYAWWYLDAVSDCEQYALVVIAMLGSPFSPYYAASRRLGPADPLDFVAMNAVLYG